MTETAPYDELNRRREGFQEEYLHLEEQLTGLSEAINRDTVIMQPSDGTEVELPLYAIIDAWQPNSMSGLERVGHYFRKVWAFITDDPLPEDVPEDLIQAILIARSCL